MERLANTKPLPIPKRRPHPRPTLRDPHSSTAPWSQEGVAELGGERVRAAVALLELAGQAHPEVVHVVRRQPRRVTRRPLEAACGLPRYAVRTVRPRLVRVPGTYSTRGPGGRPPCASGTYTTREAGTRSLYVPNGGPGAYVSAQAVTGRSSSSWPRLATRVPARESTCRLASPSSPEGDSSGFACSHSSRSAVR